MNKLVLGFLIIAVSYGPQLQAAEQDELPNPYRTIDSFVTLPPGRVLGSGSASDATA